MSEKEQLLGHCRDNCELYTLLCANLMFFELYYPDLISGLRKGEKALYFCVSTDRMYSVDSANDDKFIIIKETKTRFFGPRKKTMHQVAVSDVLETFALWKTKKIIMFPEFYNVRVTDLTGKNDEKNVPDE